jgi:ribosomal protein L30/L7E
MVNVMSGSNSWILLPMESSAVREGGNPILNVWVVGLVNIINKTILVIGVEELLIMRIENDLRALRLKKLNHRIQLLKLLNLDLLGLKKINPELAYDLENKYDRLISNQVMRNLNILIKKWGSIVY